jgi:uncharacterized membrane protein
MKRGQFIERLRIVLRWLAAFFFICAGSGHFLKPEFYVQIVPPGFPAPRLLVIVSGICEIAGGIGLLLPSVRKLAGWGLIALLIAVFPANIYMALHSERFGFAPWLLWARLPLQLVFGVWIWFVSFQNQKKSLA